MSDVTAFIETNTNKPTWPPPLRRHFSSLPCYCEWIRKFVQLTMTHMYWWTGCVIWEHWHEAERWRILGKTLPWRGPVMGDDSTYLRTTGKRQQIETKPQNDALGLWRWRDIIQLENIRKSLCRVVDDHWMTHMANSGPHPPFSARRGSWAPRPHSAKPLP